jgi:hypothetical protein
VIKGLLIISSEIEKKIIEFLVATPKALALIILSFFSGQLWFFVLITYFKSNAKGNKYLNNYYSKLAIGIIWFIIVNLPIHFIRIGFEIDDNNIFLNFFYTIIYGFVLQGIIFTLIVAIKKEK